MQLGLYMQFVMEEIMLVFFQLMEPWRIGTKLVLHRNGQKLLKQL